MFVKRSLQILALAGSVCSLLLAAETQSASSPAEAPAQLAAKPEQSVEHSPSAGNDRLKKLSHSHGLNLAARRNRLPVNAASTAGGLGSANSSPSNYSGLSITTQTAPALAPDGEPVLPLWTYDAISERDGNHYHGTVVGSDPFKHSGTSQIPTLIVPLIIETQTVATKLDLNTAAVLSTEPGVTVLNPAVADPVCIAGTNNVPVKLVEQSPLFKPASFSFGGTNMGTGQYIDAFQRANFWNAGPGNRDNDHLLLDPVRTLPPIVIHVPAAYGLALTSGDILGPPAFCAPLGIVDITWFDNYLRSQVIPELSKQGLNPKTFPIFLTYNTFWSPSLVQPILYASYHSVTGKTIPVQTYAVAEFDSSTFFYTGGLEDVSSLARAVADWVNNPFSISGNATPLWQFVPPSATCAYFFNTPAPLYEGQEIPPLVMPNGFTYHLPELAFFSWFFGGQSLGVNGWYSNNNTLKTDAGPPCVE